MSKRTSKILLLRHCVFNQVGSCETREIVFRQINDDFMIDSEDSRVFSGEGVGRNPTNQEFLKYLWIIGSTGIIATFNNFFGLITYI